MPSSLPPRNKAPASRDTKRGAAPTGATRGATKTATSPLYKGPGKSPSRVASKAAPKTRATTAPKTGTKPLQPAPLTSSQRRYLRGLCHDLKPVLMLGAKGLTAAVHKELALALDRHELVKIKLSGGDREERQQQIDELLEQSGAELVQQIGHVAGVFRRNSEEPRLALPR